MSGDDGINQAAIDPQWQHMRDMISKAIQDGMYFPADTRSNDSIDLRRWRLDQTPLHDVKPSYHPADEIQRWKTTLWNDRHEAAPKFYAPDFESQRALKIQNSQKNLDRVRRHLLDDISETQLTVPNHNMLWNPELSEVYVRHIVRPFAHQVNPDGASDKYMYEGVLKNAPMIHPLYYSLIDPDTWRPRVNLVNMFITTCLPVSDSSESVHTFMHTLNDELRYFLSYGLGRHIHELFRPDSLDYKYTNDSLTQLSNSLHDCILFHEHNLSAHLTYSFDNSKRIYARYVNPTEVGNIVEISVWPVGPRLKEDTNDPYRSKIFAEFASYLMQHELSALTGLFVEINVWQHKVLTQHCLHLSEYNSEFIPSEAMIISSALDPSTLKSIDFEIIDTDAFAVPVKLGAQKTSQPRRVPWMVPVPYVESELYESALLIFLSLMHAESFKRMDGDEFSDTNTTVDFFFEQGVIYLTINFDVEVQFIRELLGIGDDDDRYYSFVMGLRYPVLFLSLEKSMHTLRYKYFIEKGRTPSAWGQWKKGQWNFGDPPPNLAPQVQRRQPKPRALYDPEAYQIHSKTLKENEFSVKDRNHRDIFPHRLLHTLPPSLSYENYGKLNGYPDIFCVNDLTDSADIYYICKLSEFNPATAWDDLQLLRLNFEIEVSKAVVANQGDCFYSYRMSVLHKQYDHPFRTYLSKYPVGMSTWRRLWSTIYNNDGVLHSQSWHRRSETDSEVGSHLNRVVSKHKPKFVRRQDTIHTDPTSKHKPKFVRRQDTIHTAPKPRPPVTPVVNVPPAPADDIDNPVDQVPSDDIVPSDVFVPSDDKVFSDDDIRPSSRRSSSGGEYSNEWDARSNTRLTQDEKDLLAEAKILNKISIPVRKWLLQYTFYSPDSSSDRHSFILLCKQVQTVQGIDMSGVETLLAKAYKLLNYDAVLNANESELINMIIEKLATLQKQQKEEEALARGAKRLRDPRNVKGGPKGSVKPPSNADVEKKTGSALSLPSSRSLNMRSLSTLCAQHRYHYTVSSTDTYYDTL